MIPPYVERTGGAESGLPYLYPTRLDRLALVLTVVSIEARSSFTVMCSTDSRSMRSLGCSPRANRAMLCIA